MARFAILNTVDWEGCRALAGGERSEEEVMQSLTGCAWLFRVRDGVGELEETVRQAVREYFASAEGRRVIECESLDPLTWTEAIAWMPDEAWERHDLELLRHPDVERVIVSAQENLQEEIGTWS